MTEAVTRYDVESVRADFPILSRQVHGKPLVYLDNSASTQKPRAVVEAVERFYYTECSNVHRGLHELSSKATEHYERSREVVQRFIGAGQVGEIVFTRGTTESINLVAHGWGDTAVGTGDEILVTEMEHHSNIVPWQMLCERRGARLVVAPINDDGTLDEKALAERIGPATKLVAVGHVSNALGTRNPIERIIELAHAAGALVLLDGAQGVVHEPLDVAGLDCDFYAFSGHKIYGPTGIGVLYGKAELLDAMQPFQGGGDMIRTVSFKGTTYNDAPQKFEAGTPDVSGAIGLAAAIEYVDNLGMERIADHESRVVERALERLGENPRVRLVGTPSTRCGVVSFEYDGAHPHDVGTILDHEGVAVRAGHHCAQPLMERLGIVATVRASFGCYNTVEEADALASALKQVDAVLP